jgi:predicted PurR-regulated permease PerM
MSSEHEAVALDEPVLGGKTYLMPRALMLLLGIAAVFIAAQGIQPVRSILAAAFMALNLVIVVWPIHQVLAKYIPRFLASIMAGLVAIALLVAMIWFVGWTIARLIQELPKYASQFNNLITGIEDFATRYNIDTNAVAHEALLQLQNMNVSTVVSALGSIATGLTSIVGLVLMIVLILVLMIIDSVGFSERMRRLGEKHNATLAWGLGRFSQGARRYWVVTTVLGLVVSTFNWCFLSVLGVPLAFTWAVLSFVTGYIPIIGFVIGIFPPVVMALLANDPLTALWVIIGYWVFNTIIMTFFQPKLAGNAVGITPTVAVLSLLLWSYVLGPLGAILAVPATLLVKTLLVDIDPRARWLNAFIAANPTTSDQDPILLSRLLERAKRIRKLTAEATRPGVKPEKAQAATRELATLTEEEDLDVVEPVELLEVVVDGESGHTQGLSGTLGGFTKDEESR